MHATSSFVPATSHRSAPILSLLARSTAITAYTSAAGALSTTRASRTDFGTDRWRTFLSIFSREAAAFGFDAKRRGSIAGKQWRGRVRAWASPAIGS
jgi:hypothetical protein